MYIVHLRYCVHCPPEVLCALSTCSRLKHLVQFMKFLFTDSHIFKLHKSLTSSWMGKNLKKFLIDKTHKSTSHSEKSKKHTAFCGQHATHSLVWTASNTQPSVDSMQHTAFCGQHATHSLLWTACNTQPSVDSMQHTAFCGRHATHSLLWTACNTQPSVDSMQHTAYTCVLHVNPLSSGTQWGFKMCQTMRLLD